MPSHDAVLFDLDGTLLRYRQDNEDVMAATFDGAGVDPFCDSEDLMAAADDVPDAEDDHHFMTQAFEIAAERHGGPESLAPDLAAAYDDAIDHTDVAFREGAEAALARARETHRVGLVTNGGPETQRVKLDALDIADAFETTVFAGAMTDPKPSPEPFEYALDDLGVEAGASLYVGNSLSDDVAGAQGAGLRAAWFPAPDHDGDPGEHDPEHVLESLYDLDDVLGR